MLDGPVRLARAEPETLGHFFAGQAALPGLPEETERLSQHGDADGEPTTASIDITGRQTIAVKAIQAFLTVEPANDGSLPSLDAVRLAERVLRMRLALDRADRRVLTIGDQPVSIFKRDEGPVRARLRLAFWQLVHLALEYAPLWRP